MEWKLVSSVQSIVCLSCAIFFICQIAVAYPQPEDYEQHDQGMREILAELERQGGLTAPMVPRGSWFQANPNHQMMRKSQRSNSLRLRFGKRSAAEDMGLVQEQPLALPANNLQPQRLMEPRIQQEDSFNSQKVRQTSN